MKNYRVGEIITWGEFPRDLVTSPEIIEKLNNSGIKNRITIDGVTYQKYEHPDGNISYFVVKPIEWIVIKKSTPNKTLTLMTKDIIDCVCRKNNNIKNYQYMNSIMFKSLDQCKGVDYKLGIQLNSISGVKDCWIFRWPTENEFMKTKDNVVVTDYANRLDPSFNSPKDAWLHKETWASYCMLQLFFDSETGKGAYESSTFYGHGMRPVIEVGYEKLDIDNTGFKNVDSFVENEDIEPLENVFQASGWSYLIAKYQGKRIAIFTSIGGYNVANPKLPQKVKGAPLVAVSCSVFSGYNATPVLPKKIFELIKERGLIWL